MLEKFETIREIIRRNKTTILFCALAAAIIATPICTHLLVRKTITSIARAINPSSTLGGESDAERQAKAYKAYQDYQYVKTMGPISGPMYRSTKW